MSEKLLRLGASPAQADLHARTPLYYLAATAYTDLLDAYLQHDQPAVKRVINHLAFKGHAWRPDAYSAFSTAVDAGDVIGAIKLLDSGAEPTIAFDAFMKSAQLKFDQLKRNTSEVNEEIFGRNVCQPIISAVENDLPVLALELIARGADPNTLTPDGFEVKTQEHTRGYTTGKSLLDCVRHKVAKLRRYKGEKFEHNPPNPLDPDDSAYLNGLEDGTYRMWTAQHALKEARMVYKRKHEEYEKKKQEAENRRGLAEKAAAVKDHLQAFEKLEHALLEKGGKTFRELYPDITPPVQQRRPRDGATKHTPFEVKFSFNIPDLTTLQREGYTKLWVPSYPVLAAKY